MDAQIHVLGIRHHGPGSARMIVRALQQFQPSAVLIEGPADAQDALAFAGHAGMKPPVALLVYEPARPSESAYYPFATFSPEWQAIRWGLSERREVRFIDLPRSLRTTPETPPAHDPAGRRAEADAHNEPDAHEGNASQARRDPLESLAQAAGFADGEAWWGRLIEENRSAEDALALFDSIREAMASARTHLGPGRTAPDEPAREAHMRRAIRAALKDGFDKIAVICGAWHAPVLTAEALTQFLKKADDDALKGLAKRKTAATWIPWTYDRLSMESGYGAGITSPGWYEHLWQHHHQLTERWMSRVARLMRDEDLDASPGSVIESVRLAESLATMRGRTSPGLEELGEATLAILCHGNPMPMRVIRRELIVGTSLGEVPDDLPTVPLQQDLASLQKSLRLKLTAVEELLDLDQRKELDLSRSRLLHRLAILQIPWGTLQADQQQRVSTFHEIWRVQWKPEFAVRVMEAARWGNTVEEAAAAFISNRARASETLAELTELLDHVIRADLPGAVGLLVAQIQRLSAVAADVGSLMDALPPLARVLRYGDVRKTDTSLVGPVVEGLFARVCVGLPHACASLDDDAAEAMRDRLDALHAALANLGRTDFLDDWKSELRKLGDADIHGLVAGRAWRYLLDSAGANPEDAATRLARALSPGNDPAKASGWLEGFLGGSGMLLVHDDRLLNIVDDWLSGLSPEAFEQACPIARRTFSSFEKPERRMIGERVKRGSSPEALSTATSEPDYQPDRGALVEPVLRLILGNTPDLDRIFQPGGVNTPGNSGLAQSAAKGNP